MTKTTHALQGEDRDPKKILQNIAKNIHAKTLQEVADVYLIFKDYNQTVRSRLAFWILLYGDKVLAEIGEDEVDTGLAVLAERGKLSPVSKGEPVYTGKPLAPGTINRYLNELGSVFRYAVDSQLLPRGFVSPTLKAKRKATEVNKDAYFRKEEFDTLLKVARVHDNRWGKMPALLTLAYHTGLRKSNIMDRVWGDIDLEQGRLCVGKTKNGDPIYVALSSACVKELSALKGSRHENALVFKSYLTDQPFQFDCLYKKLITLAKIPYRNFHQLRHGCGAALAQGNVNQAQIMDLMGHKSLVSSQRYLHIDTTTRKETVARIFG